MRIRCIIRSMDSTLKIWGNKMGKKRLPVQCWDKSWLCLPVYLWQTILGLSNFSSFLFLHLTLIQPFEIMQRCHLAVLLMPLGLCCPVDTPGLSSSSLCLRGPTLFFLGSKSSDSSSLLKWGGISDTVPPYLAGRQADSSWSRLCDFRVSPPL